MYHKMSIIIVQNMYTFSKYMNKSNVTLLFYELIWILKLNVDFCLKKEL